MNNHTRQHTHSATHTATHPLVEIPLWLVWRLAVLPVSLVRVLFHLACAVGITVSTLPGATRTVTGAVSAATTSFTRRPGALYVITIAALVGFAVLAAQLGH